MTLGIRQIHSAPLTLFLHIVSRATVGRPHTDITFPCSSQLLSEIMQIILRAFVPFSRCELLSICRDRTPSLRLFQLHRQFSSSRILSTRILPTSEHNMATNNSDFEL